MVIDVSPEAFAELAALFVAGVGGLVTAAVMLRTQAHDQRHLAEALDKLAASMDAKEERADTDHDEIVKAKVKLETVEDDVVELRVGARDCEKFTHEANVRLKHLEDWSSTRGFKAQR